MKLRVQFVSRSLRNFIGVAGAAVNRRTGGRAYAGIKFKATGARESTFPFSRPVENVAGIGTQSHVPEMSAFSGVRHGGIKRKY